MWTITSVEAKSLGSVVYMKKNNNKIYNYNDLEVAHPQSGSSST